MENVSLIKKARLEYVSKLYRQGYKMQEMLESVQKEMEDDKYSMENLQADIDDIVADFDKMRNQDVRVLQMNEYNKRQDLINLAQSLLEKSNKPQVERTTSKLIKDGQVISERVTIREFEKVGNITLIALIDGLIREQGEILRLGQKFDAIEKEEKMLAGNTQIDETRALIESFKPKMQDAEVESLLINDNKDIEPLPFDEETEEDDTEKFAPDVDLKDFMK